MATSPVTNNSVYTMSQYSTPVTRKPATMDVELPTRTFYTGKVVSAAELAACATEGQKPLKISPASLSVPLNTDETVAAAFLPMQKIHTSGRSLCSRPPRFRFFSIL